MIGIQTKPIQIIYNRSISESVGPLF